MRALIITVGLLALSGCVPVDTDTVAVPGLSAEVPPGSPHTATERPVSANGVGDTQDPEKFPVLRASDVDQPVTDVISQYLRSTDAATRSGGVDSSAMEQLVTAEWWEIEQRGFEDYQQREIRTIGTTTSEHLTIQSARWTAEGSVEVAVFACIDASSVWIISADSNDPPDDLVDWLERGSPAEEPTEEQATRWEAYAEGAQAQLGVSEPVLLWLVGSDPSQLRIDATETWRGYHPCDTADASE